MCLADIVINRHTSPVTQYSAADVKLGPSPRRVAILITSDAVNANFVVYQGGSVNDPIIAFADIVSLPHGAVRIGIESHGNLVTQPIYISNGGGFNLWVTELILTDDLSEILKRYKL